MTTWHVKNVGRFLLTALRWVGRAQSKNTERSKLAAIYRNQRGIVATDSLRLHAIEIHPEDHYLPATGSVFQWLPVSDQPDLLAVREAENGEKAHQFPKDSIRAENVLPGETVIEILVNPRLLAEALTGLDPAGCVLRIRENSRKCQAIEVIGRLVDSSGLEHKAYAVVMGMYPVKSSREHGWRPHDHGWRPFEPAPDEGPLEKDE